MRIRLLLLLLALLAPSAAWSQASVFICPGPPGIGACTPASATNPFPVSATISGFTALTTGTPISVTTGGVSGTLPAGAVVVATNVGTTNAAYCALGASATTSSQYIPPGGGWFAFTVGAATQLTCITSTSTTTVNMTGGSGIATGTGGGSGGGGGSSSTFGAAFPATGTAAGYTDGTNMQPGKVDASGNVLVNPVGVAQGSITSGQTGSLVMGAVTTAAPSDTTAQTSPLSLDTAGGLRTSLLSNGVGATAAAVPVNASYQGLNVGGSLVGQVGDPCQVTVPSKIVGVITSATTTNILAGTAAQKIYVCYFYMQSGLANNVAVIEGTTGGTCGSGTAALVGGTTAANGLNNAANSGQAFANGGAYTLNTETNNNDICLITSSAGPLSYVMKYVKR